MNKTNVFILAILLAMMAAACNPQTPQQVAQAAGPRAWIDDPLHGSDLPLAAHEIVCHGSDPNGVSQLEIKVNGAVVASVPSADPSQTLVTARYTWTPPAPGNYTLQARAQGRSGTWGEPATAVVTVGGEVEPPAPTSTPGPTAESTAVVAPTDAPVPPTSTPVPPTWTPVPPTWTPVPPTWTPAPVLSADMEPDTDRPGMDYKDFDLSAPDPNLCRSACFAESNCLAYTYVKPGAQGAAAHCWLKSGVPPAQPNACCISGVKPVTATPAPQGPKLLGAQPVWDTFHRDSACGPTNIVININMENPDEYASGTFHYRLRDKASGERTAWISKKVGRIKFGPYGGALGIILDALTELTDMGGGREYAVEYYFVITNTQGASTQSPTYENVTFKTYACGVK
jgi:hypothetical protein